SDKHRVAALQFHPLRLCCIGQVSRRNLEVGWQGRQVSLDKTSNIQEHATIDQEMGWVMGDIEVCTDSACVPTDASEIARRCRSVQVAKEESVASDVADGIDARRAVLAAEVLHLGGEGELPPIAELAACSSCVVV